MLAVACCSPVCRNPLVLSAHLVCSLPRICPMHAHGARAVVGSFSMREDGGGQTYLTYVRISRRCAETIHVALNEKIRRRRINLWWSSALVIDFAAFSRPRVQRNRKFTIVASCALFRASKAAKP